jgi:dsRNA-specific ribonuclease
MVEARFDERTLGRGSGPTKREAEQAAAADALESLSDGLLEELDESANG